jgi:hypothetical protein
MSDISNRIADLSPRKLALLSKLYKQKSGAAAKDQSIPRRSDAGACPLSFAQERLWFTVQWANEQGVYNIPMVFRVRGALDFGALERSLNEIVRRHEVLRTSFAVTDEQPQQVVAAPAWFAIPVIDLRELAGGVREAEAHRLASEQAQQAFDLSKGPMLRMLVLKLGTDEHGLIFTMHHILSDEWSIKVLINEVSALYQAFSKGASATLAELPIQYADYAVWQRQLLQGETLERLLAYWRQQLGGTLPVLNLPTDKPRPAEQTFRGATQVFRVPLEVSGALKDPQRHEGVTLFMSLLAAFAGLLYCHTGQEDIVVGTDVANRNRIETEALIGFFTNQLALRIDLSGDVSFRELLARVREVTLGAYAHQDLPFERLVKALQPKRDPARSPLFQVKFVLQNDPPIELDLEGLTLSPMSFDNPTAKFDLLMTVINQKQELTGSLEYNTDLWNHGTIAAMLKSFEVLLARVVSDPDVRLSELREALAEADRRRRIKDQEAVKDARHQKLRGIKPKSNSARTQVTRHEQE